MPLQLTAPGPARARARCYRRRARAAAEPRSVRRHSTFVLDAYAAQPSNLRRAAFRGSFDGRDGFTLSLWRSDEGMRRAAYHPGTHRTRIDEDKAGLLSDRTSFTRLRVIRSWDDWDGEVAWTHP